MPQDGNITVNSSMMILLFPIFEHINAPWNSIQVMRLSMLNLQPTYILLPVVMIITLW
jgi:hypothetical protein